MPCCVSCGRAAPAGSRPPLPALARRAGAAAPHGRAARARPPGRAGCACPPSGVRVPALRAARGAAEPGASGRGHVGIAAAPRPGAAGAAGPGEGAAGTPARPRRPQGGGRGEAQEEGPGARQEQDHGEGQSREVGDSDPDEQLMRFVTFCFAPEEYHKKKPVNHLRENLQYMLKGRLVADKAVTEQILAQNRGRKSKDQPPEKTEKKKPEGTVFTEEDFRKFEREYFGIP